jgi:hypothetical protein
MSGIIYLFIQFLRTMVIHQNLSFDFFLRIMVMNLKNHPNNYKVCSYLYYLSNIGHWCKPVVFSSWFQKEPSVLVLIIILFLMDSPVWSRDKFFEFLKPLVLVIFTKNLELVWLQTRSAFMSITHNQIKYFECNFNFIPLEHIVQYKNYM